MKTYFGSLYTICFIILLWCYVYLRRLFVVGVISRLVVLVLFFLCWWCSSHLVLGRMESERKHVIQIPNLYFSMYLLRIWQRENFWNDFCPPLGPSASLFHSFPSLGRRISTSSTISTTIPRALFAVLVLLFFG